MGKLENKDWLENQYETKSMQKIADELGCSKTKVRNAIKRLGIKTKNKSEAQKAALESGRATHPTAGTTRSDEVKEKISKKVAGSWENYTEEEKEKRRQIAKENWESRDENERKEFTKKGIDAAREAGKTGSKLEKFVFNALTEDGYSVEYHVKGLVPNENLEVDMFIHDLSTAIEIDGPSHFQAIWSAESLARNQRSDVEKQGLLLKQGFVILRVKQMANTVSQTVQRKTIEAVRAELDKIHDNFPEPNKRLIQIEV